MTSSLQIPSEGKLPQPATRTEHDSTTFADMALNTSTPKFPSAYRHQNVKTTTTTIWRLPPPCELILSAERKFTSNSAIIIQHNVDVCATIRNSAENTVHVYNVVHVHACTCTCARIVYEAKYGV